MLAHGPHLNERPAAGSSTSYLIQLAKEHLRIRDRNGCESHLIPNPAQLQFERTRGRQNIIVKARQMGITTWIAARFFLKTITARGVLTVQVAHTREAAESIFRIVQRLGCLPDPVPQGLLRRSRANVAPDGLSRARHRVPRAHRLRRELPAAA